jgi:flavin-dependent dehydrogenase
VRATLDAAGSLGERIRAGRHVGPLRGTVDLPNAFRQPYGPDWALAGDAGLVMDSITGQGIGHALRDADLLAASVAEGLGGTNRFTRRSPVTPRHATVRPGPCTT